jgi:hypothetical protein
LLFQNVVWNIIIFLEFSRFIRVEQYLLTSLILIKPALDFLWIHGVRINEKYFVSIPSNPRIILIHAPHTLDRRRCVINGAHGWEEIIIVDSIIAIHWSQIICLRLRRHWLILQSLLEKKVLLTLLFRYDVQNFLKKLNLLLGLAQIRILSLDVIDILGF